MMFYERCNKILRKCPNGYAKAYAQAGISVEGQEAKVQALYILNNITHWRGEEAKACRAWLKEFSKAAR